MSIVWLSKVKWETLWSALHNIVIRQNFTVKTPSAGISGSGTGARLHIDLPANDTGGTYDGPFAVTLKENKLNVSAGWLNCNGTFNEMAAVEKIEPKTGYLCLHTDLDEKGEWITPEFKITAPAADAFPVAEIKVDEKTKAVLIRQFPVTVAVIMLTKQCPLAEVSRHG